MTDAIIVGAGFGGLSSAIELAAAGLQVTVVEALPRPGGKAGIAAYDGVEFDTGPSVLTLPEIFDRLFRVGGSSLRDEVELLHLDPGFEYLWPDNESVRVYADTDKTLTGVRDSLGAAAGDELSKFLRYAQGVWEAAAPHFVFGEAPTVGTLLRIGTKNIGAMTKIDGLRSMRGAIESRVKNEKLRVLLQRYATYNGSDPSRAPATLNCIAHVEMGLGYHGVRGGVQAVVRALHRTAVRNGVEFRFDTRVDAIEANRSRVTGVRLAGGERLSARTVIANADVSHVAKDLLPGNRHGLKPVTDPSMSGWTGVLKARRRDGRVPHTVFFPRDYAAEFTDIFDRDRPPMEPTLYLCAQARAHGRQGWPGDAAHPDGYEAIFVMANAPAEPAEQPRSPEVWERLKERVLHRLDSAALRHPKDDFVWSRTPTDLARTFPGTRGAIYGGSSNGRASAFQRPSNRIGKVRGLYLASGGAHPGGGMPLCVQSGRAAADALLSDLGVARARVA